METKTLNLYEVAHENNVSENINASTIEEAIEQSTIPEEESAIVHAIRIEKDIKTVIQDRPAVVEFVTEIDDGRPLGTQSVNIATPLQGKGHSGDTVTLQAIPNKNYEFVRWELNDIEIGTEPLMAFTLPDLGANGDNTDISSLGNYNLLLNKPKINGVELTDDKTAEELEFTVAQDTFGSFLAINHINFLEAFYDDTDDTYYCKNLMTGDLISKELFDKGNYLGTVYGGAKLELGFTPNTLNDYELNAVSYFGQMFKEDAYIKFEADKVVVFTAYDEAEEIERDYSDLISEDFTEPVEGDVRSITYLDLMLDIDIAMQNKTRSNKQNNRFVTVEDLMRLVRLLRKGV